MNMMPALLATVRFAAFNKVVLRNLAANLTGDAIGVAILEQPIKARFIVWKIILHVFECISLHHPILVIDNNHILTRTKKHPHLLAPFLRTSRNWPENALFPLEKRMHKSL